MHRIQTALFLFSLFTYSTVSQASLLVEPVLGYNLGTEVETKTKDGSGDGMGYGGRLGYQTGPFQVGLDYLNSSICMSSSCYDLKEQDYGLFFGFEFPILVRAYGVYIFSSNGETEINDISLSLDSGSGYKLGVGFTLLPYLDLNLDYRAVNFNDSVDVSSFLFSASMPFNFF